MATGAADGAEAAAGRATPSVSRSRRTIGLDDGDLFGEGGVAEADLGEEMGELMQQDALLQRLVSSLQRAKTQGEEALALAQSVAEDAAG